MKRSFSTIALFITAACAFAPAAQPPAKETRLIYPPTHRGDQVDDYHGTQVADPYRHLEDLNSEQTKDWVAAQNKLTFNYLSRLPKRNSLRERLTKLWDYERFGLPRKKGSRYFYTHNDGLQNQSVLYVAERLDAEPRLLLDPNKLSADGTVDLAGWQVSEDGNLLAYGISSAGSDWKEWKVLDVATGRELSDHLKWVKFSTVSWTPDNRGVFYSRYDEPQAGEEFTGVNFYQKLFYHRIGEPQSSDTLVYERPDQKKWGFGGKVTEDGRYLVIGVWRGSERKNQLFYQDLKRKDAPVVELITGFDADYDFIGSEGSVFWITTDLDAPRRRVMAVDVNRPQREHWREVIAQSEETLLSAGLVGKRFFASYLKDASSLVRVFDLAGKHERDVKLPGLGSSGGFDGDRDDDETFYSFTNFTTPGIVYRYDIASGESTVFRRPKVDFNPDDYETRQVFCTSRDGTRLPMFITHKKGLKLDGDNPTILYAYGGFEVSLTPSFSVSNLAWLEAGGVYASANLRGGGEYGRPWHEAGMLDKKQNVFDDFFAAAEWLIANKYTSSRRLAIRGGSNGGLLVGAAIAQRPELFAAAVPAVGVMDMLRYHKFTIGWAWTKEYGSSDDAQQFKTLYAYSPLHNLKPGTKYPATLVTTGDHDDRVVPGHSFKFAAALQAAQGGEAPALIRIETRAGHGAGKPTTKLIDEAADVLAFLLSVVGK